MIKKLSCHCGGVEGEVSLPDGLKNVLKCNCSLCKKKGITMINKIGINDLKITKGKDLLKLYQYHSKTAKHFFCTNCGIYTHHNPRSNPNSFCVNFACLEGVDPFELKDIPVFDGTNHPHDKK
tara:strand:+ start:4825 stop:5193 length:369 start_codon:yes stop_codon:yes gene_type:complete